MGGSGRSNFEKQRAAGPTATPTFVSIEHADTLGLPMRKNNSLPSRPQTGLDAATDADLPSHPRSGIALNEDFGADSKRARHTQAIARRARAAPAVVQTSGSSRAAAAGWEPAMSCARKKRSVGGSTVRRGARPSRSMRGRARGRPQHCCRRRFERGATEAMSHDQRRRRRRPGHRRGSRHQAASTGLEVVTGPALSRVSAPLSERRGPRCRAGRRRRATNGHLFPIRERPGVHSKTRAGDVHSRFAAAAINPDQQPDPRSGVSRKE